MGRVPCSGVTGVKRARYITLESIAPDSDDPIIGLPAVAV